MKIIEITENKKQYLDLLLLADEQETMIDRYLYKGKMYVLDDNGIKCECVVTDEGNGVLEIKNIATVPEYQGKGYAKALIDFIVERYGKQYAILQVGTGDSLLTIPFYEKCGFIRSHSVPHFFTDNYDHPIYEDGVQLVDMIYLRRRLQRKLWFVSLYTDALMLLDQYDYQSIEKTEGNKSIYKIGGVNMIETERLILREYTNVGSYNTAIANGMKRVKVYADSKNTISYAYAITKAEWEKLR